MALRFASLGSGSRGNATLVQAGDTCLLVDCGFTIKETERRLACLGLTVADISALLVTHEHSDHIKGVGPLARRHGLSVYSSFGTHHAVAGGRKSLQGVQWHELRLGRPLMLGTIEVEPVAVPHDAREPCQFVFRYKQQQLGVLTDLGSVTEHVINSYRGCDALLLECNHDVDMLAVGPYPASLKRRVGGNYGHLNNHQAAALLQQLECERLQHLVLSHLSEHNNRPDLALAAISPLLDNDRIVVASQDAGFGWHAIKTAQPEVDRIL